MYKMNNKKEQFTVERKFFVESTSSVENIKNTANKQIQIDFNILVQLLKDKEINKMNEHEIDMYNSLFKVSGYNIDMNNYIKHLILKN